MSASEQDPLPIDPADLRVGDVLKQYPAGKLVGLVVAIFLFGGGLAFSFQEWRYSWELRALRDSASVREKYLEKALSTGESTEQRRVFLRFLRDVEEDEHLRRWAENELTRVDLEQDVATGKLDWLYRERELIQTELAQVWNSHVRLMRTWVDAARGEVETYFDAILRGENTMHRYELRLRSVEMGIKAHCFASSECFGNTWVDFTHDAPSCLEQTTRSTNAAGDPKAKVRCKNGYRDSDLVEIDRTRGVLNWTVGHNDCECDALFPSTGRFAQSLER